jgi:hypothetical protein
MKAASPAPTDALRATVHAVRWVRLDAAAWAPQSPTPHQAYRFAAKLTAALRPAPIARTRESS